MQSLVEKIIERKRRYFWDKGPLNPERDKFVIISRVLELGAEAEVKIIIDYYGIESVKKVVRESRELSPKTVNFFVLRFGLSREETKCFTDASRMIWKQF